MKRTWTPEEWERLADLAQGGAGPATLRKHLGRSYRAIVERARHQDTRLGDVRRQAGGCRTMVEIARLMGVTHQMVQSWIVAGDLAQAAPRRHKAYKQRWVTDGALLDFLAYRPAWPDWVPATIADADWRDEAVHLRNAACGCWLTPYEVAARYGVAHQSVHCWIAKDQIPAMPRKRRYYIWSADLAGWQPPYETYTGERRTAALHKNWQTRRQKASEAC